MTLGERIAALRREKGLSQEALGELVGVTRQAVSKWEADRAIPDVDNCIAMSRALGVSLARLLELEESDQSEGQDPVSSPAVLPEEELARLVQRLDERYAAHRRQSRRRWRWPMILVLSAALVGGVWLYEWLHSMDRSIEHLSGELAGLQGEIISGVNQEVQQSLHAENSLIADQRLAVVSADLEQNTWTWELAVTLKEGTADTEVQFLARQEDGVVSCDAAEGNNLHFTSRITLPIRDSIPLYLLIHREDGTSQTQLLDQTQGAEAYAISLANASVTWTALQQSGLVQGAFEAVSLDIFCWNGAGLARPVRPGRLEVVTFLNDVQTTAFPVDLDKGIENRDDWFLTASLEVPVEVPQAKAGDRLTLALLAEDNYGRRSSQLISCYQVLEEGKLEYLPLEVMEHNDGTYGTEVWQ